VCNFRGKFRPAEGSLAGIYIPTRHRHRKQTKPDTEETPTDDNEKYYIIEQTINYLGDDRNLH